MKYREEMYDVIVVGAGPAGTTAAHHCAKGGLKTLLLEKERLPRVKPCAGGVTAAAVSELGFEIPQQIIERQCTGMRVLFRGVEKEVRAPEPISLMVTRSAFDQHLATMAVRAGTILSDGEECTGIERGEDRIVVRTDLRVITAPVIIGADGFFSRVRKFLRIKFEQDEIRFCVLAKIPMSSREISSRFKDLITIHYGYVSMGYTWIFPKGSHLSVGAGGALSNGKDLPNRLREFLSLNHLDPNAKLRGCFIPVSRWRHDMYSDRILLVGDAAGLVDSFSGEGIRFAIASGKLAAETVLTAHRRGDFSVRTMMGYQERCWEQMGNDLDTSNRATDLLFRHSNLLLGTAIRNEEVLEQYLRSVTGEISFSDYIRWLKRRRPRHLIRRFLLPNRTP
jgi:geranylgeranyl reductase family protein